MQSEQGEAGQINKNPKQSQRKYMEILNAKNVWYLAICSMVEK